MTTREGERNGKKASVEREKREGKTGKIKDINKEAGKNEGMKRVQ